MSAQAVAYPASEPDSEGDVAFSVEEAMHALAQPLTALSFAIDLARLQDDPAVWREALETARTECRRAMQAVKKVQNAAQLTLLSPAAAPTKR